jgi:hypothetical protein
MQKLGLYAAFILVLTLALALFCFTFGAVIFWRRSDDWMALLIALMAVSTVTLNDNAVFGAHSAWGELGIVMYILGSGIYILVLALFPDGRFMPRWAPWILLCWAVSGTVTIFFPDAFFGVTLYNLVWRAALVMIVIAQVYRYRTAYSPVQRQQGKWIFFGGSVVIIIDVGLSVPGYIFPSLMQASSFYQFVTTPVYLVISLIYPLCLGLAILRYRLWDIDIIIHRTLVYSTLTVVLAVIYEVSVFTLQTLTSGLTFIKGNQLAIIASTFLIGGLFKPVYDRTRSLIDRRFYRRKYDAARTVAAFSETIRDEVDLNQLCAKLTAVVQETMQPTHVSLWLSPPKRYGEKTTRALPIIDTESES